MVSRIVAVALFLVAPLAFAGPVALHLGQTKTVKLSVAIAKASVDDGAVVEVYKSGRDISLTGKAPGKTTLHVKTVDGDVYDFTVHCTDGGTVYSTGRDGDRVTATRVR